MAAGILHHSEFWALVGVCLGFILGEGSRFARHRYDIRKKRRLLLEELKSIRGEIEQKIDLVSQIRKALAQGRFLPGMSVPIVSVAYNSVIRDLYPYLNNPARSCLHTIYERLFLGDEFLRDFERLFMEAQKEKIFEDAFNAFDTRMMNLEDSYHITAKLIDSYLSGHPIDVFNTKSHR
jgi:hypothetical protein